MSGFTPRPLAQEALQRSRLPSGVELHWAAGGQGAPLVFVHGVMGDWLTWAPQWEAFTPHFACRSYSRRYNHPNRNTMPSPAHSALVEAQDRSTEAGQRTYGALIAMSGAFAEVVGASTAAADALASLTDQLKSVASAALAGVDASRWSRPLHANSCCSRWRISQ